MDIIPLRIYQILLYHTWIAFLFPCSLYFVHLSLYCMSNLTFSMPHHSAIVSIYVSRSSLYVFISYRMTLFPFSSERLTIASAVQILSFRQFSVLRSVLSTSISRLAITAFMICNWLYLTSVMKKVNFSFDNSPSSPSRLMVNFLYHIISLSLHHTMQCYGQHIS